MAKKSTPKKSYRKSTKIKKGKSTTSRSQHKQAKQKIKNSSLLPFRITIFQIKLAAALVVLVLSYRYPIPIDSLREQEYFTLAILSVFLLTKPSPYQRLMQKFSYPRIMGILIFFALIFPLLLFLDTKYQDWDNAQMIKGLARDFPALVEEVEAETGLNLELKSDCMTTTEKFTEGVKTCEVSYLKHDVNQEIIDNAFEIVNNSPNFKKSDRFQNEQGFKFNYRNLKSCTVRNSNSIYTSCITAVRDANVDLAIQEFSNL